MDRSFNRADVWETPRNLQGRATTANIHYEVLLTGCYSKVEVEVGAEDGLVSSLVRHFADEHNTPRNPNLALAILSHQSPAEILALAMQAPLPPRYHPNGIICHRVAKRSRYAKV